MHKKIGCDISKDTIDVYILSSSYHFKTSNNETGYKKFIEKLPDKENLHICMEATGNYYENFADYLSHHGYQISVVNPLKIKEYSRSKFSRTKTDRQDAKIIAQYCEDHKPPANYKAPSEQQYRIKRLIGHIARLKKQQTMLKNQIESTKDADIAGHLHEQLRLVKSQLKHSQNTIAQLNDNEDLRNIDSIPAIGKTTAAILVYYLSFYQFQTANQFTAFAGLCPQKHESGKSVKKRDKTSYLGNRTLKSALYMNAVVAYRIGLYRGLVGRMKDKGKSNKQILVAIMRKLACLAFTLWQKKEAYRCS